MSDLKTYRPELEARPPRIAALPVHNGYPVPFFVDYLDGEPEFRAMDPRKFKRCIDEQLCWVCGQKLSTEVTFTIGPMCGINRTTAEPPSHLECARWSVRNCPFLSKPNFDRREAGLGKGAEKLEEGAGFMIRRNPGVTLLWRTKGYRLYRDGRKGFLIEVGKPIKIEWWSMGKSATREQVEASVVSGLPFLLEACGDDQKQITEVTRRAAAFAEMYPAR